MDFHRAAKNQIILGERMQWSLVTEKTVLVYPELLVSMVPIYFGFEKSSKEIHEAYSLESRPQPSKSETGQVHVLQLQQQY